MLDGFSRYANPSNNGIIAGLGRKENQAEVDRGGDMDIDPVVVKEEDTQDVEMSSRSPSKPSPPPPSSSNNVDENSAPSNLNTNAQMENVRPMSNNGPAREYKRRQRAMDQEQGNEQKEDMGRALVLRGEGQGQVEEDDVSLLFCVL